MAHSIWIPSLQKFCPFNNITTRQQLELARTIELDITKTTHDFDAMLVDILQTLSGDSVVIEDLSLLDKLTIVIQLAINGIGASRSVPYLCPLCEHTTMNTLSVPAITEKLKEYLDKDYRTQITHKIAGNRVTVTFDVVPTRNQLKFNQLMLEKSGKGVQDVYQLLWLSNITIHQGRKTFAARISDLTLQQMQELMRQLPQPLIKDVQRLAAQHDTVHEIASLRCAHCQNAQPITFKLQGAAGLITTLLQLDISSIYSELFELKHNQLIGSIEDGLQLAPVERTVYRKLFQAASAKSSSNSES
jgi:hypothetical protein